MFTAFQAMNLNMNFQF